MLPLCCPNHFPLSELETFGQVSPVLTWSCVMEGNVTPDNADNGETLPTVMITPWVGDSHWWPPLVPMFHWGLGWLIMQLTAALLESLGRQADFTLKTIIKPQNCRSPAPLVLTINKGWMDDNVTDHWIWPLTAPGWWQCTALLCIMEWEWKSEWGVFCLLKASAWPGWACRISHKHMNWIYINRSSVTHSGNP